MAEIVGRTAEQNRLIELYNSHESEFIAIYGRRRVGKTYLVTELFREKCVYFEVTGQYKTSYSNQLMNFTLALQTAFSIKNSVEKPSNWNDAFEMLKQQLET